MPLKVAPFLLGALVLLAGVAVVAAGRTRERQDLPAGLETATFALG